MVRIISKFKRGEANFQLIAQEWPTFLYDERVGWNPDNIRDGLFRGHVLIRVCEIYLHVPSTLLLLLRTFHQVALRIFRNRTAASADTLSGWFDPNKRASGPKCMLERYKIQKVSRSMIAYAALQVIAFRNIEPQH